MLRVSTTTDMSIFPLGFPFFLISFVILLYILNEILPSLLQEGIVIVLLSNVTTMTPQALLRNTHFCIVAGTAMSILLLHYVALSLLFSLSIAAF